MTANDVVTLLLALAPYVVPPIAALLFVAARSMIEKLPAQQRALVAGIVQSSVAAIEQTATSTSNGPAKKQLAVELIGKQLAAFHINVAPAVVESLLEEAVMAINAAKGAATVATTSIPVSSNTSDAAKA
jgi:hypothetical protein